MRNSTIVMTGIVAGAMLMAGTANADRDDWPRSLTVGTASQGGTYYIYGSGWANLVGDAIGVPFGAEVTGGPVQNATLVQMGEHDFGMVTMGPAYEAWTGQSELAPGVEHKNLRALFPMYQTPFQAVALQSSGINDASALDGKRVSVGPAGGTSATRGGGRRSTLRSTGPSPSGESPPQDTSSRSAHARTPRVRGDPGRRTCDLVRCGRPGTSACG